MEIKTTRGQVLTFDGVTLDPPISFDYKHKVYATLDEVAPEDQLAPADILKATNDRVKSNERAKGQNAALQAAGIEKKDAKDDGVAVRDFAKTFVLRGMSQEDAIVAAKKALGIA